jgi:hypothetical protein
MSRLHVVAQFTFRIVTSVALTTGDSSQLWLCHERLPPSTVQFFLGPPFGLARTICTTVVPPTQSGRVISGKISRTQVPHDQREHFHDCGGSKEVYEVEKSEDGTKVTFRLAANPRKNFVMAGSAVYELIKVLRQLAPYH